MHPYRRTEIRRPRTIQLDAQDLMLRAAFDNDDEHIVARRSTSSSTSSNSGVKASRHTRDRYKRLAERLASEKSGGRKARIVLKQNTRRTSPTSPLRASSVWKGKSRALGDITDDKIDTDFPSTSSSSSSSSLSSSASSSTASSPVSTSTWHSLYSRESIPQPIVNNATNTHIPSSSSSSPSSSSPSLATSSASASISSWTSMTTMAESSSSPTSITQPPSQHVDLKHNVLILILIVIAAVVLVSMLCASLAWLFRLTNGNRRRKRLGMSIWSPQNKGGANFDDLISSKGRDSLSENDIQEELVSLPRTPFPALTLDRTEHATVGTGSGSGGNGGGGGNMSASAAVMAAANAALSTELGGASSNQGGVESSTRRGWALYDPPVPTVSSEEKEQVAKRSDGTMATIPSSTATSGTAVAGSGVTAGGGGDYNVAKVTAGVAADQDLEGFDWPPPVRRPSFIERLLQQRGIARGNGGQTPSPLDQTTTVQTPMLSSLSLPEPTTMSDSKGKKRTQTNSQRSTFTKGPYPTVRPLPGYGIETPLIVRPTGGGMSRFAGLGASTGKAMFSMIPATLRHVAGHARSRSVDRRLSFPSYLDRDDCEGMLGATEGQLPMAKRINQSAKRFTVDASTEEEDDEGEEDDNERRGKGVQNPHGWFDGVWSPANVNAQRMRPFLMGTPEAHHARLTAASRFNMDSGTPGLAGVGAADGTAAWSSRRRHTAIEIEKLSRLAESAEVQSAAKLRASMDDAHTCFVNLGTIARPQHPLSRGLRPLTEYQRLQMETYSMAIPYYSQEQQPLARPNHNNTVSIPPFERDRHSRLVAMVSKWQDTVKQIDQFDDPYTMLPGNLKANLSPSSSLTRIFNNNNVAVSHHGEPLKRKQSFKDASEVAASISSGSSFTEVEETRNRMVENDQRTSQERRKVPSSNQAVVAVEKDDVVGELRRAPSIRPQFAATTQLSSWLDPSKVTLTQGFGVVEENADDDDDNQDKEPFTSDVERSCRDKKRGGSLSSESDLSDSSTLNQLAMVETIQFQNGGARDMLLSKTVTSLPPSYHSDSDQYAATERRGSNTSLNTLVAAAAAATANNNPSAKATKTRRQKSSTSSNTRRLVAASPTSSSPSLLRSNERRRKTLRNSMRTSAAQNIVMTWLFDSKNLLEQRSTSVEDPSSMVEQQSRTQDRHQHVARAKALVKARAKVEADAAIAQAIHRRKVLSISSRGSTRTRGEGPDTLSVYSVSTTPELIHMDNHKVISPLLLSLPSTLPLRMSATKQTATQRRAYPGAKRSSAAAANQQRIPPTKFDLRVASKEMIYPNHPIVSNRRIGKQRVISSTLARNVADLEDPNQPDSPWTSSDSDISLRRWGDSKRISSASPFVTRR